MFEVGESALMFHNGADERVSKRLSLIACHAQILFIRMK